MDQDESSIFIRELAKYLLENNDELTKEYNKDNYIYCNISNKNIANEKAFDLEKSIESILNDFKKTFQNEQNNEIIYRDNKFYRSENQMIKIAKHIINDNPAYEDGADENFTKYFIESINKQVNFDNFYLITFDISVPIISPIINTNNQNYYRQEIFINNIDF